MPEQLFDQTSPAHDLPRAKSWLEYDYYELALHPELRPDDPSGEMQFMKTVERIRQQLETMSVLSELDDSQQFELAALVCDLQAKQQEYSSSSQIMKRLGEVASLIGTRRLKKFERAIGEIEELSARLPDNHPFAAGRGLKNVLASLKSLPRMWQGKTADEAQGVRRQLESDYPQAQDPTDESTWRLYSFFTKSCRLLKNEAEVRVAKIGNELFGWKIAYRDKYEGDEQWKGSPTIRQRIARYSRKKSHRAKKVAPSLESK